MDFLNEYSTLTPEDKKKYMASLSPEERAQLIDQMSAGVDRVNRHTKAVLDAREGQRRAESLEDLSGRLDQAANSMMKTGLVLTVCVTIPVIIIVFIILF